MTKRKRLVTRTCGICGRVCAVQYMVKDIGSDTGYICFDCEGLLHPEYDEFGEE